MRALLTLLALLVACPAGAQVPPGATMAGWERSTRVAARDRLHAHGGLFFDRGLFRQLTPGMDHEYNLDLGTIGWTPREDAAWLAAPIAFRMQAGSISRGRFAHRVDVRVAAELGAHGRVWLDAVQEENMQASRLFSEVGLSLRAGRHEVGLAQTFGHYKPDLDLTLAYVLHARPGRLTLRAEVFDVANDFIFETLGTHHLLEPMVRRYERAPLGASLAYASNRGADARVEVYAGVQPMARAQVEAFDSGGAVTQSFRFWDAMAYAGVLAERRVGRVRAGGFARGRHSRMRRTHAGGGYRSAQHLVEAGVTLAAAWPRLRLDAEAAAALYADLQRGDDFSASTVDGAFRYDERQLRARLRADVPVWSWLALSAVYLSEGRTGVDELPYGDFLPLRQSSPNARLSGALLFSLSSRAHLALGGSFDLGGDVFSAQGGPPNRYDGGYVRLTVAP